MNAQSVIGGLIFVAAALIVSGFAIALWFESFAVITGREPTISQITALQIGSHPVVAGLAFLLAGILIGTLITHFTHWLA
jgi:F0F1-type ATP synthase membrane subunit c/vacuolar-type H+-ATPase subunit K